MIGVQGRPVFSRPNDTIALLTRYLEMGTLCTVEAWLTDRDFFGAPQTVIAAYTDTSRTRREGLARWLKRLGEGTLLGSLLASILHPRLRRNFIT